MHDNIKLVERNFRHMLMPVSPTALSDHCSYVHTGLMIEEAGQKSAFIFHLHTSDAVDQRGYYEIFSSEYVSVVEREFISFVSWRAECLDKSLMEEERARKLVLSQAPHSQCYKWDSFQCERLRKDETNGNKLYRVKFYSHSAKSGLDLFITCFESRSSPGFATTWLNMWH
jgi:hypothetical protein